MALSDIGDCDKKDKTKHTNIIKTKNKAKQKQKQKSKQNKNAPVQSVSLCPTWVSHKFEKEKKGISRWKSQ